MSDTDFARQLADRFTRWQNHCLRARMTPVLCITFSTAPDPEIEVLGCEEAEASQVFELLTAALRLSGSGRRPLGPAAMYELRDRKPALELHEALAAAGQFVPMSEIRSWPPEKFFDELYKARQRREM